MREGATDRKILAEDDLTLGSQVEDKSFLEGPKRLQLKPSSDAEPHAHPQILSFVYKLELRVKHRAREPPWNDAICTYKSAPTRAKTHAHARIDGKN